MVFGVNEWSLILGVGIGVVGSFIAYFLKWWVLDKLDRRNIANAFKIELQELEITINDILQSEGILNFYNFPVYPKSGIYHAYYVGIIRFEETLAKNLIRFYKNLLTADELYRIKKFSGLGLSFEITEIDIRRRLEESLKILKESKLIEGLDNEITKTYFP